MCTVSAALSADGAALRIVINRDERRLRMQARPPAVFERDGVPAIWPVDQHAGGTWAALNAHGLAFALLNASSSWGQSALAVEPITRGSIVPFLTPACDIDDAVGRFASGPAQWPCRPFKLLVASRDRTVVLTPHRSTDLQVPFVLATSSLGDELVDGARRALFEHLLENSPNAWRAQDRLHQHAWPDRRHLSALMSRVDACTVSRTEMVIVGDSSEMRYAALIDGWPAGVVTPSVKLAHRRAVAAA